MYMINHYLDQSLGSIGVMPDKASLPTTNSKASLDKHLSNCNMLYGRAPTFVLLDFYSSNGNEPFDWVAALNGVPAPTTKVETGNINGSGNSSSNAAAGAGSASGSAGGAGQTGVVGTQPANGVKGAGFRTTTASGVAAVLGAAVAFLL